MQPIARQFLGRQLPQTLKGAFYEWNEDKVPRMAAAIAFYAVFSLTPIVVIAFKIARWSFGSEVALREILAQAAFLVGPDGVAAIEVLIQSAQPRAASFVASMVGLGAMIFAATGMFTELKDSLNTIWEVQPKPGLGLVQMVLDRFFAFTHGAGDMVSHARVAIDQRGHGGVHAVRDVLHRGVCVG